MVVAAASQARFKPQRSTRYICSACEVVYDSDRCVAGQKHGGCSVVPKGRLEPKPKQ